jgi:hypothetical protein
VWRRIVTGVVVAGAVATTVWAVGQPDTRVAGIVVPPPDTGELTTSRVTVQAAAAEPTAVTTAPATPATGTQTVPPQTKTVKPTGGPPASSTPSSSSAAPAPAPAPPRFDPAKSFRIVNHVNSLVLDGGGMVQQGTAMKLWEPNSPSTNLQFQLIETGGGYYRLVNRTNGLTVDGRGATNPGAYVGQRRWDSSAAMQWLPTDAGQGLFILTNRATGLVLDGGGPRVQYGAQAKQWPADGSPNLLWRINAV